MRELSLNCTKDERFIRIVDWLRSEGKIANDRDLCAILGVAPSYISNIRKSRSGASFSAFENLLLEFPCVSAEYAIRGKGEISIYVEKSPLDKVMQQQATEIMEIKSRLNDIEHILIQKQK